MIYAIWTHAVHLSGASTDQYSCCVYRDKRSLLEDIVQILEGSRESLISLGSDNAEEELEKVLKELNELAGKLNNTDIDLTGMEWLVDYMDILIHLAEPFPDVLDHFKDAILAAAYGVFDEYDGAPSDGAKGNEEDDEYRRLFIRILSVNGNTTKDEFDELFDECQELLGEWSVF